MGDLYYDPPNTEVSMDVVRARTAAIMPLQDDVLVDIEAGKKPSQQKVRRLPPWRAVMLARIACLAGLWTQEEVDALVAEATEVGGYGKLRPTP